MFLKKRILKGIVTNNCVISYSPSCHTKPTVWLSSAEHKKYILNNVGNQIAFGDHWILLYGQHTNRVISFFVLHRRKLSRSDKSDFSLSLMLFHYNMLHTTALHPNMPTTLITLYREASANSLYSQNSKRNQSTWMAYFWWNS